MAQAQQAGNGNEDYIINVQEVWKTYRMGDQEVHALRGVNLNVIRGSICPSWGLRDRAKPRCSTWSVHWTRPPRARSWSTARTWAT